MKTDTKRMIRACFVAGGIFYLVALWLAPAYQFLGLLTGFVAGALSCLLTHDFKKFKHAVSVAWENTIIESEKGLKKTKVWLSEPHPMFCIILLVFYPVSWTWAYYLSSEFGSHPLHWFEMLVCIVASVFLYTIALLVFAIIVNQLITLGLFVERSYCLSIMKFNYSGKVLEREIKIKRRLKFALMEENYKNDIRWFFKGLVVIPCYAVYFVFWRAPKFLLCVVVKGMFILIGEFLYWFAKEIYSKELVICMTHGPLGGWIGYQFFLNPTTVSEAIIGTIFSGIMGVALGFLGKLLHDKLEESQKQKAI